MVTTENARREAKWQTEQYQREQAQRQAAERDRADKAELHLYRAERQARPKAEDREMAG